MFKLAIAVVFVVRGSAKYTFEITNEIRYKVGYSAHMEYTEQQRRSHSKNNKEY